MIARNSSFSYKGKAIKIQNVAKEMGVRYVLEGSVQKAGERVRINIQLIDALNGHHLWAESYDRILEDIFAIQDEVSMRLMEALQAKIITGERFQYYSGGTGNVKAFIKFLKGVDCFSRMTAADNLHARNFFEEAIKYGKQALALNPNNADSHALLAGVLTFSGESKEGFEHLEKALRLNPVAPFFYYHFLGHSYKNTRQYNEAIQAYKTAVNVNPDFIFPHIKMSQILKNSYSFLKMPALNKSKSKK